MLCLSPEIESSTVGRIEWFARPPGSKERVDLRRRACDCNRAFALANPRQLFFAHSVVFANGGSANGGSAKTIELIESFPEDLSLDCQGPDSVEKMLA